MPEINGNGSVIPSSPTREDTREQLERSLTLQQVGITNDLLSNPLIGTLDDTKSQTQTAYDLIRKMRKDPTITLARRASVVPPLKAGWSVESKSDAKEEWVEFVKEQLKPWRQLLTKTGMENCLDFGWSSYEIIWGFDEDDEDQEVSKSTTNVEETGEQLQETEQTQDVEIQENQELEQETEESSGEIGMNLFIKKIKPLLHDITWVRVSRINGSYAGIKQDSSFGATRVSAATGQVYLDAPETLLLNFDVEGTNWYGQSTMLKDEECYTSYLSTNEANDRHNDKIAGTHWVVHYPVGKSDWNGTEIDNGDFAKKVISSLQSSGGVAVPNTAEAWQDDVDADTENAWKIEMMSADSSVGSAYNDRLKYLDTIKVRAFGWPERAILEGNFGTKAEAEAHGEFALVNVMLRFDEILQLINEQLVDRLLLLNFGEEAVGTVYLVANPLNDEIRATFQGLYNTFLNNEEILVREAQIVDAQAIRDKLEIPTVEEGEPFIDAEEKAAEKEKMDERMQGGDEDEDDEDDEDDEEGLI